MRLRSRREVRHMGSKRNRLLVLVSRLMNDSVSHPPMLIGNVRAWLKYVSEILSAQEGKRFWVKRRVWSRCDCSSELDVVGALPGNGKSSFSRSNPRRSVNA